MILKPFSIQTHSMNAHVVCTATSALGSVDASITCWLFLQAGRLGWSSFNKHCYQSVDVFPLSPQQSINVFLTLPALLDIQDTTQRDLQRLEKWAHVNLRRSNEAKQRHGDKKQFFTPPGL